MYEFVTEDPQIEAAVNIPVNDQLAFRVAARGQDMSGGYIENQSEPLDASALYAGEPIWTRGASYDKYPAQKQAVVRFTTVWEPNEQFDATLKLFRSYTKRNDAGSTILWSCADGPGAHPTHFGIWPDPTQTCPDAQAKLKNTGPLPPLEVVETAPALSEDSRFHYKLDQYVHTLQMNMDLGNFTLSSATGLWDYRHREFTNYGYTSWAVVVSKQGESGEALTQELRLASNLDGPVNFTLGGFYENAERTLEAPVQLVTPSLFLAFGLPQSPTPYQGAGPYEGSYIQYHQIWDNDIESWSLFASVDADLGERFSLSAGARYTEEDRSGEGGNVFENSSFFGFGPAGYVYEPQKKSDNLSPEIVLRYQVTDDVMVYGGYRTGFQSAGISNPGTVPNLTSLPLDVQTDTLVFDETTIQGFEFGLKGTFLGGRARADLAGFWYELEDLQVAIFNSNTTTFTLQNAAVAHNWGFEADLIAQVSERLQVRVAGQYNHLEYDKWDDAGCHPVDNAIAVANLPTSGPGCHPIDPGNPASAKIQDLSGIRYGNAPFSANVGFTYDISFADWDLALDWDTIHHSKGKRVLNQPFTEVPSRTVTHLSATLRQSGSPWQFGLICSNCFNEIYVTSIGNRPLAKIIPGVAGDLTGQVAPPRLVTLRAAYDF